MRFWPDIAVPFIVGGIVVFSIATVTIVIGTRLAVSEPLGNGAPQSVGRFAFAPATTSNTLWILDTATGRIRGCAGDAAALTLDCGDWRPN